MMVWWQHRLKELLFGVGSSKQVSCKAVPQSFPLYLFSTVTILLSKKCRTIQQLYVETWGETLFHPQFPIFCATFLSAWFYLSLTNNREWGFNSFFGDEDDVMWWGKKSTTHYVCSICRHILGLGNWFYAETILLSNKFVSINFHQALANIHDKTTQSRFNERRQNRCKKQGFLLLCITNLHVREFDLMRNTGNCSWVEMQLIYEDSFF